MTVRTLTKQLLKPEYVADKNLQSKIQSLNKELAATAAAKAAAQSEMRKYEGATQQLRKSYGKYQKGNRFAAFSPQEKEIMEAGLKALVGTKYETK